MKKTALIASSLFALPLVAFAQGQLTNIQTLIQSIGQIVGLIIPILGGCAIAFFFYGLVDYIRNAEKGSGKKIMIAGLTSLFVMVSLWGIIQFAQIAILPGGAQQGGALQAPTFR